jgi:hypothetical protein
VKKGDALATQGACAVALMGVWNFRGTNEVGGKTALPEWECVALNGRRTFVVFDSDVMLKASVYSALTRLVAFLRRRGAECYVVYLAALPGGAKQGVDDFLAGSHGIDDLLQLATDELREPQGAAASDAEEEDDNASQATLMVALTAGMDLFHDDKGDAFICIELDGHVETWSTRSGSFKRWLARAFYLTHGKAPRSASIADAITTIEGKALFECEERQVLLRVGEHTDGTFHLDLGNKSWQTVAVSEKGWSLQDCSPVRFRRGQTMTSLPVPQRGGSLDELRSLLNIETDDDFMLIVAWLLGCLRPHGPYPVLAFIAEQGSGKTSAARILRSLIDPSSVALGGIIREERDLMIAARANHVVAVDNVSSLPQWFSDALCRLATGGGWMTRRLYTDAEQEVFTQTRPVLLTGIEEFLSSGDLLDRTILINLPAIPPEKRKQEADLERDFQAAWPGILGCLLDAASCALRTVRTVNPPVLPRMADFATWVIAAEPALGWQPGTFLRTYLARANAANEIILEASMLSEPIRRLVVQGPWTGTASQLLEHLKATVPEEVTKSTAFPKTAKAVGNHLRRLAPNLRSVGIDITFDREGHAGRRRMIFIRRLNSENTVQNVQDVRIQTGRT